MLFENSSFIQTYPSKIKFFQIQYLSTPAKYSGAEAKYGIIFKTFFLVW